MRDVSSPQNVTREIQAGLSKAKCYDGPIDGVWGRGSRFALGKFVAAVPGIQSVSGKPELETLNFIRKNDKVTCRTASLRKAPAAATKPKAKPKTSKRKASKTTSPSISPKKKPVAKPKATATSKTATKKRPAKKKACTNFSVCVNQCIKYDPPGGPGQCPKLCSQRQFGNVC